MKTGEIQSASTAPDETLLRRAMLFSVITIAYNVVEGVVSVGFGASDETLALFGFGLDSFVEVISGVGIAHLVLRMRRGQVKQRDGFERTALRVTGFSFSLLAAGLLAGSVLSLIDGRVPETTVPGLVIAVLSLLTMYWLMRAKLSVGRALQSDAIIADANCTKTCFYLSAVLLFSSGLFALTGIGWVDQAGSLAIAWFAFSEGREAFEKARSGSLACGCHGEDDACAVDS